MIVLHGTGTSGKAMAAFTGLARRGPAAGFATVFPDGLGEVWDRGRALPGREEVSDTAFIQALVDHLVAVGVARLGALWLVGMSNGAFFVEHLARHGLVDVSGIVLVAGAATEDSRRSLPCPAQSAAVLCFAGSADPVVPYGGGLIGAQGSLGTTLSRLAVERGEQGDARLAVAAETVAGDWAAANSGGGTVAAPAVSQLAVADAEFPVTCLSWSAPACHPVVLYRIEGGGHTWPGGPQYLPVEAIGAVARHLDATGILLEMARGEAPSLGL